jgi:hypothetical protein
VSLPADVLFLPDKAALTPRARQALFEISSAIAQIGNQIDVHGRRLRGWIPYRGPV